MADIYVKSGGTPTSPYAEWADAAAKCADAAAIDAAGDTIYLSHLHAETSTVAQTIAIAGTLGSPSRVLCVNDGAEPPTTLADTAQIATTGGSNISLSGQAYYMYGVNFVAGSSANNAGIYNSGGDGGLVRYENCLFKINNTSASPRIGFGATTANYDCRFVLDNCRFGFGNSANAIGASNCKIEVNGGGIESGTAPSNVFYLGGSYGEIRVSNFDFTNAGTACALIAGLTAGGRGLFYNCTLADGWSGALHNGAVSYPAQRFEMHNCRAGSVVHQLWVADYAGEIRENRTVVKSGGANDGAAYSWKFVSSAACAYPSAYLESPEFSKKNDSTSAITATVEIVTDSATALTDGEIWLEVSYPGASGQTIVTDAKASVLATAADQASSSVDWTTTGLSTPLKQKLSVTFTPADAGWLQAKVKLAKPSTTVYVDPMLTVA